MHRASKATENPSVIEPPALASPGVAGGRLGFGSCGNDPAPGQGYRQEPHDPYPSTVLTPLRRLRIRGDKSLTDTDSLPSSGIIAVEIVDDLEAALEQFTKIAARLK